MCLKKVGSSDVATYGSTVWQLSRGEPHHEERSQSVRGFCPQGGQYEKTGRGGLEEESEK